MMNIQYNFRRLLFLCILIIKFGIMQAQVPVHKEPRHHPVFQSKDLRILDVLLPPGDTSQYHVHTTPSLFIRFTSTVTGSQLQGGSASSSRSVAGTMLFENLAPPDIRIHRVWNADKDVFHVMDVELLYKDSGFVQKPLSFPDLKLEIDTAWVRAYRLTLVKGKSFTLPNKKNSFILVSLNNGVIEVENKGRSVKQNIKPGSFFDIRGEKSFSVKNTSDEEGQFILIELPLK